MTHATVQNFLEMLDEVYADESVYLAAISREEGTFLHALIRLMRPESVVEIGTHSGVSALWMARALADNAKGHLYGIDPYVATSPETPRRLLERAGLLDRVTIVREPSVPNGLEWCRKNGIRPEFVFIDGDHRVEPAAADLMGFWEILKPGGLIAIHDTSLKSGWEGPEFVMKALRSHPDVVQAAAALDFLIEEGHGLSVIQKIKNRPPRIIPWWAYLLYHLRTSLLFRWKGK